MGFATAFCPLTMTGAAQTVVQTASETRFVVERPVAYCSTKRSMAFLSVSGWVPGGKSQPETGSGLNRGAWRCCPRDQPQHAEESNEFWASRLHNFRASLLLLVPYQPRST